eukprot:1076556-Pyramimonas_sp.AAC.1
MPALPASDWSVIRIYPRLLRLIGPHVLTWTLAPMRSSEGSRFASTLKSWHIRSVWTVGGQNMDGKGVRVD